MNFRAAFLLMLSLWGGWLVGQEKITIETTTTQGVYEFRISDLQVLTPMYDTIAPYYMLFLELGDGNHLVKKISNPLTNTPGVVQFSFKHTYVNKDPIPTKIQGITYPLYSIIKKPTPPDIAPPGGMTAVLPGGQSNVIPTDILEPGSLVFAGFSWSALQPQDIFTVIAGVQNDSLAVIDLTKNQGILSIYYDRSLVSHVTDQTATGFRAYLDDVSYISFDPSDDEVVSKYQDSHGYNLNGRIDFLIPQIDNGVEEFVFANFMVNSNAPDKARLPIVVAIRAQGDPSGTYRSVSDEGKVSGGRDPNEIVGYLFDTPPQRPACLAATLDEWKYNINFYNEGTGTVDSFHIKVEFPEEVLLNGPSDIKILSVRIGKFDVALNTISKPELTGPDNRTMEWAIHNPSYFLYGLEDPFLQGSQQLKEYSSAEITFLVPRNMAIGECDTVFTKLTIGFPDSSQLSFTDGLPCECTDTSKFPCNIVPDIPFLGGCWCTLLVIVLLAVILLLIIVIARNAAKPKN